MTAPVTRSIVRWTRGWRKVPFQRSHPGASEVAADQAQVQVPALRPPLSAFDLRGDDLGIARGDDPRSLQPVQAGAHGALGQAGVADQGGHRRERGRAIRPSMVGQADEHEFSELQISGISG
jgi:hypothetical protein